VSLILRKGPGSNIGTVGPIADSIANNGSYFWNIPSTLPAGIDYALQIIVGPASNVSNVGPDAYNFTPQLELRSNFTGNATITTPPSSSAVSSGSSASGSNSVSQTASDVITATVTPSGTRATGSGATQTAGGQSTASSSAARIEGISVRGNCVFAFIVALAIGIAVSF
jgi:Ser-Thr-rich glycosyl-phosphatidyl-inositol-anchored membrane family